MQHIGILAHAIGERAERRSEFDDAYGSVVQHLLARRADQLDVIDAAVGIQRDIEQELPVHRQQQITTALWFRDDAEAAVRFYVAVFADGAIVEESRWGEGGMVEDTLEELTGEPTRVFFVARTEPDLLWDLMQRATTAEEAEEARWLWTHWGRAREDEANGLFRFFERHELTDLVKACGAPKPRIYMGLANQAFVLVAEKAVS